MSHAFTVLSDKDKRAHYDQFGEDDAQAAAAASAAAAGGYQRYQYYEDELSPEDLFNMLFGGGLGSRGARHAARARPRATLRGADALTRPAMHQTRVSVRNAAHTRSDSSDIITSTASGQRILTTTRLPSRSSLCSCSCCPCSCCSCSPLRPCAPRMSRHSGAYVWHVPAPCLMPTPPPQTLAHGRLHAAAPNQPAGGALLRAVGIR